MLEHHNDATLKWFQWILEALALVGFYREEEEEASGAEST